MRHDPLPRWWRPECRIFGTRHRSATSTAKGLLTRLCLQLAPEVDSRTHHPPFVGVRAIADDVDVSPTGNAARSDSAIAAAAANALEWDSAVPDSAAKATVRNGWVTLTGTVGHQFQKTAAELWLLDVTLNLKPHCDESSRTLTLGVRF